MQYSVSPRWNPTSRGPKPERKLEHPDADPPRHQEMAELVDEDQHAEHEHERRNVWMVVSTVPSAPSISNPSARRLRPAFAHAPRAHASSRAHLGQRRRHRRPRDGPPSSARYTRDRRESRCRPSRKDATATSLAAFSTTGHGRRPPRAPGTPGAGTGNSSRSGSSNSSGPQRGQVERRQRRRPSARDTTARTGSAAACR